MSTMAQLGAVLSLTTRPFQDGLKKARGSLDGFGARTKSALSGVGAKIAALGGLIGTGALVAGLKKAANAVDNLAKTSDRLGITTQALAGLRHAADLSGAGAENMDKALRTLAKTSQEAAAGTGEARAAFARLGVDAQALAQLPLDQRMAVLADAFQGVGSKSEQTALAMRIFGESGAGLVNTLALGADGLAKTTAEAEALGLAVSRVDAAKVEQANDAMTRIGALLQGVFQQAVVAMAPAVQGLATAFVDTAVAAGGIGPVFQNVVDYLVKGVDFIARGFNGLRLVFHGMAQGIYGAIDLLILAPIDNVARAFQYVAGVAEQFGTLLAALWESPRAAFGVFVAWVQARFAEFTQGAINNVRELINATAMALFHVKGMRGVAEELMATNGNLARYGALAANAQRDLAAAIAEAKAQGGPDLAAIAAPIETTGIPAINAWRDSLQQLQQTNSEAMGSLADSMSQTPVWEAYQKAAAAAQAQAEATAALAPGGSASGTNLEALAENQEAERQQTADHLRSLNDIWRDGLERRDQWTKASAWGQAKDVFGALEATTRGVAKNNKALFKINQLAGIANAVVNTAEGATLALAKYPPPLGAIMAATVVAAGAAQIAAIKSASFGGGGSAPSVAASMPAVAPGAGTSGTPEQTLGQPRQAIQITLAGDLPAVMPREFVLGLMEEINRASRDGASLEGAA